MILVLDFGSQYNQLIVRRVREAGVYCEIHPFHVSFEKIKELNPKGIILSGGPRSVYEPNAPIPDKRIFELGIPILGICYGMQLLCQVNNGEVKRAARREYGHAMLDILDTADLFSGLAPREPVWMSHGDALASLPDGFESIGRTEGSPYAAMRDPKRHFYAVQFHPEVTHTPHGACILSNFVHVICGCARDWSMESFAEKSSEDIRRKLNGERALCAVSGGVDSSVAAALMNHAVGDHSVAVFVDNGLLRKNEREMVEASLREKMGVNLKTIDARREFLDALAGVTDPEHKRKTIGRVFIEVFQREAAKLGDIKYLVQGTLYPDVIESVSVGGPSDTIKSHHNVGGLPDTLHMQLVEPLRFLFKDEVRELGATLGLPDEMVHRHPFPGPGLAVRCLGEITEERLHTLKEADAIFLEEIDKAGLYRSIGQAFAVLTPLKSVGVMGDERTYANVLALRAVATTDFMTADWFPIPHEVLRNTASRIIGEVSGINRVVYDITSKPPGTIEWE